jgi:Short C-terminal domain
MFVAGLVGSIVSGWWSGRTRRKAVVAASPYFPPSFHPSVPVPPAASPGAPRAPIAAAQELGDEGVRLERLKTLAALRDSGALSHEEFETEKRRILGGY